MTLRLVLPIAFPVLLAGCITPTPYRPAVGPGPGYREQQIEDDRYRVTFRGNRVTPRETVETYLLYRAAELTLERGFDYFVVTERATATETSYDVSVFPVYGYYPHGHFGFGFHRFPYYAYGYPWAYNVHYRHDREFEAIAYIVLRRGEKPEGSEYAYDAREVKETLEPQIRLPGDESKGSQRSGGSY